jgi:hypothetical protein
MSQAKRIDWHRWFGIGLTEHFHGTPWRVELEKELALKRQLLDVVIIEQADSEATLDPAALDLPDGLENLRAHNLLTYKSHQEALDAWALDELIGHYVNYRKLLVAQQSDTSAAEGDANNNQTHLLPEAAFQLYAVATREPLKLLRQLPASALQPTDLPGVHGSEMGPAADPADRARCGRRYAPKCPGGDLQHQRRARAPRPAPLPQAQHGQPRFTLTDSS